MELKVILYLTAGLAYIIYKQFRKLQEEAIVRKAKLDSEKTTYNYKDPKSLELKEELFGEKVRNQKKENFYSDQQSTKIVKKEIKNKETAVSSSTYENNVGNENPILPEIDNSQLSTSNADEIGFAQVRNMILFSELLKRPCY